MEKVTVFPYVFMHLTRIDFISAFVGWLMRCVFDWYNARHKVVFKKRQPFTNARYINENWDRLLVSNVLSLGLLIILPEICILVFSAIAGHPVNWISGFSALIGLGGFEIINSLMKGGQRRLTRLIGGDEVLSPPDEGQPEEPEQPVEPEEPEVPTPRPRRPGPAAVLLLVAALVSGCAGERQHALNKAQRYSRKLASIYAQYPDLVDSTSTKQRDTLRTRQQQGTVNWTMAQDTTAFGRLLDEYVRQRTLAYPPLVGAPQPAPAYNIPASPSGPGSSNSVASKVNYQTVSAARLRQLLQRGAHKDTVYRYQDAYIVAQIGIKEGRMQFVYTLLSQKIAYDKYLTFLRPAAALPENCLPKRFWQDWLFWVLGAVSVVIGVFWSRLRALLPI